jgi:hypothetical protein
MWWRFLLPALAMTAALMVLFAGVMGDLKSWPDFSARAIAIIGEQKRGRLLRGPRRPRRRRLPFRRALRELARSTSSASWVLFNGMSAPAPGSEAPA